MALSTYVVHDVVDGFWGCRSARSHRRRTSAQGRDARAGAWIIDALAPSTSLRVGVALPLSLVLASPVAAAAMARRFITLALVRRRRSRARLLSCSRRSVLSARRLTASAEHELDALLRRVAHSGPSPAPQASIGACSGLPLLVVCCRPLLLASCAMYAQNEQPAAAANGSEGAASIRTQRRVPHLAAQQRLSTACATATAPCVGAAIDRGERESARDVGPPPLSPCRSPRACVCTAAAPRAATAIDRSENEATARRECSATSVSALLVPICADRTVWRERSATSVSALLGAVASA